MTLICGIDEAGRGPILGPLVICGAVIEEDQQEKLCQMGAKDSKMLSAKQREGLIDSIRAACTRFKLLVVEPAEIDSAVLGGTSNLNWLEADKAVILINSLQPDKTVVDCPSPNIPAFTNYIESRLKHNSKVVCAHHADRNFPIVSAASILAKVERDRLIEELKKRIGIDFGSGYGHDPATLLFIDKYWNTHKELFRQSWRNYKEQVKKAKQATLDKY